MNSRILESLKKLFLFSVLVLCVGSFTSCSSDNDDEEVETTISYTLTMSPDLLKFVTPQVSYVDENGVVVTITGVEDLDGKVIESQASVSKGGSSATVWGSTVISGTGYKCWTIQMKFKRLNFHSYMGVKYLRNDFIEDKTGKSYDFHHNVNTSVSVARASNGNASVYSDSHVSVEVGNYRQGDDIEQYLKELRNNPDKVGYYIDGNGNTSRSDDFKL